MSMDYRELLRKYIEHVSVEEGTDFLDTRGCWDDSPTFTDEEWSELLAIRDGKEPEFEIDYNEVAYFSGDSGAPIGQILEVRTLAAGIEFDVEFFCIGTKACQAEKHANDCPKWEA